MAPTLRSFPDDTRGNIAVMFALAAFVLFGLVGAAVDYSRAAGTKTNLQRAVDGAALLAAKNSEQLQAQGMTDEAARDYVRKTFSTERISDMQVKITWMEDRVRVEATANVPTTLANIVGIRAVPVAGTSEALFGDSKVEIALVLDNTGSMNQSNKLTTLKSAAKSFLDKMQKSTGGLDSLRIGIVPFETDVNLGSYKTAWWVDPAQTAQWTANPATSGCIWDREQPNDVKDTLPSTGVPSTMFGADATRNSACNLAPIVPLTGDFSALRASINGMNAVGTTNLTIGLVWGYHLLSPSEPISNALPFGTKNLTKYLILMTDGENTKSRGTSDVAAMDARTRQACDSVKAAGITLFTARIINGNASLLQDCASNPTMYYDVQDVAQLEPVFTSIYATITGSRIAR
ncbi:MAG: von Willebrand factor type domain protein [Enterovirga sp.]|nr:von Willebrand factor type domain protein [Enterovirga sp.]